MLAGADDLVKPDRHILNWLRDNEYPCNVDSARVALAAIAADLTERRGEPVTPWEVDNAIWRTKTGSRANW